MKKFLVGLMFTFLITSCGNMSIGMGEYKYKKIHISLGSSIGKCYEIKKWYNNQTGIEVEVDDYGHLFLSEGTSYILVSDKCPICDVD